MTSVTLPSAAADRDDDLSTWFTQTGRDLPWRVRTPRWRPAGQAGAWGVLVSEVMLQQTPVARVIPAWTAWLERWPRAAALAADPPAAAIRAWDRLGYPRRALRLHAAAVAITDRHDGQVPDRREDLRALPGLGEYTAGAVLAFAHGQPAPTLDTNVRRVLARHDDGVARPADHLTAAERRRVTDAVESVDDGAAWMAGLMELGALVCRARDPQCAQCPLAQTCRWRAAGFPAESTPRRRQATYAGSDRQARGALLAVLRRADGPISRELLDATWAVGDQRERALAGLLADGLVVTEGTDRWALPT